ncbi:MAG: hypothetical protein IPG66_18480 [Hydrogenophilales bacterium]|nr:hypothetical protein [Hydrogenophilales bacterium]
MTSQIELWLMTRGQGMILVSPDDVALIALPPRVPPSDIPHLEAVQPELADKLSKTINKRNLIVVHLHVSLPAQWQRYPWEGLTLKGRRLFGKVLFCRYASFSQSTPDHLLGSRVHVHSMWPDSASVTEILKPAIAAGHLRVRPAALAHPWPAQSWRDIWSLAVVAHGSDDIDIPAVDELGQPWSMPPLVHWPPVVILLACGNDSSLIRHAEQMLAAGAKAVIVGRAFWTCKPVSNRLLNSLKKCVMVSTL